MTNPVASLDAGHPDSGEIAEFAERAPVPVVEFARPTLRILGTRGIPAAHGGFETFAEHLALFLAKRGWKVVIYCQQDCEGPIHSDSWNGVERIHIPVAQNGPKGTVIFDWKASRHASQHRDLCLTLGYNTAILSLLLRARGIPNLINMDGIEWSRAKWGRVAKAWLWLNERFGCWLGTHLIADHPEIKRHLITRVPAEKITVIPYGADVIPEAPEAPVRALGLEPSKYVSVIARPEPENSLLEIVQAFSRKPRGMKLAVLGRYADSIEYHRSVKAAAGPEVVFLGAIYDQSVVKALRYHSVAYVHGHRVGGTNPSLLEALGAGNAIFAHNNRFNRWVAGPATRYFNNADDLAGLFDSILENDDALTQMRTMSLHQAAAGYQWEFVLLTYEQLLLQYLPQNQNAPGKLMAQARS